MLTGRPKRTTRFQWEIMNQKATILIVDDEVPILEILSELLSQLDFVVLTANNGPDALDLVIHEQPDLVLTDVRMYPMDGITLLRRIKNKCPDIGVVIFTGFGNEELVVEAMKAGATDFIKKPVKLDKLKHVVDNALQIRSISAMSDLDIMSVINEKKQLVLENDPDRVAGVVNQLTICAPKYLNRGRCQELTVALHEVIINAIEHGNLEISYTEKSHQLANGNYKKLLEQRRKIPRLARRKVTIDYILDRQGIFFTILDEGKGFDWRAQEKRMQQREAIFNTHGRGLSLAALYVDKLDFNEKGNAVSLSIYPANAGV